MTKAVIPIQDIVEGEGCKVRDIGKCSISHLSKGGNINIRFRGETQRQANLALISRFLRCALASTHIRRGGGVCKMYAEENVILKTILGSKKYGYR